MQIEDRGTRTDRGRTIALLLLKFPSNFFVASTERSSNGTGRGALGRELRRYTLCSSASLGTGSNPNSTTSNKSIQIYTTKKIDPHNSFMPFTVHAPRLLSPAPALTAYPLRFLAMATQSSSSSSSSRPKFPPPSVR